jgi:hypothetical protein
MIWIVLHWAQFCAGISHSILEMVNSPLPHLEAEWIKSLQKFLQDINGSVQIHQPGVPGKQRAHDEHIMDIAINMKKFKPGQLTKTDKLLSIVSECHDNI